MLMTVRFKRNYLYEPNYVGHRKILCHPGDKLTREGYELLFLVRKGIAEDITPAILPPKTPGYTETTTETPTRVAIMSTPPAPPLETAMLPKTRETATKGKPGNKPSPPATVAPAGK